MSIENTLIKEFQTLSKDIVLEIDGSYIIFGRYLMTKKNGVYLIENQGGPIGTFSSTRTAMSWCLADRANQLNLARNIRVLDLKLYDLRNDINVRTRVGELSKSGEFKDSINAKISNKILYKNRIERELNDCVKKAKYYYQRGIPNETVRTIR